MCSSNLGGHLFLCAPTPTLHGCKLNKNTLEAFLIRSPHRDCVSPCLVSQVLAHSTLLPAPGQAEYTLPSRTLSNHFLFPFAHHPCLLFWIIAQLFFIESHLLISIKAGHVQCDRSVANQSASLPRYKEWF